jgi:hypothetical protein
MPFVSVSGPGVLICSVRIVETASGHPCKMVASCAVTSVVGKLSERFPGWGNFRRLVVRWGRHIESYRGSFHVACMLITLNKLLDGF